MNLYLKITYLDVYFTLQKRNLYLSNLPSKRSEFKLVPTFLSPAFEADSRVVGKESISE